MEERLKNDDCGEVAVLAKEKGNTFDLEMPIRPRKYQEDTKIIVQKQLELHPK